MQVLVSLSKLVCGRRNPRRVKPDRDAHRRLVASIRSHGLLEPLVVRPVEGKPGRYLVIAGNRRLAALKEVHKGEDVKVPCEVREVDGATADALALAENFVREPMHPLDEAEEFAKLAQREGKGVEAIAAEFGVGKTYVRQRMKLATLADVIKKAYRDGAIDIAVCEAFAAVPEDRQMQIWKEVGGHPQHAGHVRGIIANAWVDAGHALFDLSALPEASVSRDLFAERVLVERQAFMEAQAAALAARREALLEEGWKEVIIAPRGQVQDRLWSMDQPDKELEKRDARKLEKLDGRCVKLEQSIERMDESQHAEIEAVQDKLDALRGEQDRIVRQAPDRFSEEIKARGTVFLMLDPDGQVRQEHRVPRTAVSGRSPNGRNGHDGQSEESGGESVLASLTSEALGDRQLATTFTHQALAVREALLHDDAARKRLLVLILHDKVRSEALSIRHDANGTTVHADHDAGFASDALHKLRQRREKLDPLVSRHGVDDVAAYEALEKLSGKEINGLIDLLTVECLTAHLQRPVSLVCRLAKELKVELRRHWRPDARWLAGYQKIQLGHLMAELLGATYNPADERRKKSELVDALATLFAQAAEGKLEDAELAERVNRWLPSNMRGANETDRDV